MFAGKRGSERAARVESLLAAGQWLRLVVDSDPNDTLNHPGNAQRSNTEALVLQAEPPRATSMSRYLDTFDSFRGAVRKQWRKDKSPAGCFTSNGCPTFTSQIVEVDVFTASALIEETMNLLERCRKQQEELRVRNEFIKKWLTPPRRMDQKGSQAQAGKGGSGLIA